MTLNIINMMCFFTTEGVVNYDTFGSPENTHGKVLYLTSILSCKFKIKEKNKKKTEKVIAPHQNRTCVASARATPLTAMLRNISCPYPPSYGTNIITQPVNGANCNDDVA